MNRTIRDGWQEIPGRQPDEGRTWGLTGIDIAQEAYVYEMLPFFREDKRTVVRGIAHVYTANGNHLMWELAERADTSDTGIVALMAATERALATLIALAGETP